MILCYSIILITVKNFVVAHWNGDKNKLLKYLHHKLDLLNFLPISFRNFILTKLLHYNEFSL